MAWRISARVLQVVALLALGASVYAFVTPKGADSWKTVEARVLSAHFAGVVSASGGKIAVGYPAVVRRYRVEYEYTVDGARYTGSGIASEAPREILHVYVDPRNPASSVIELGVDRFVAFGSLSLAGLAYALSWLARSAGD